MSLYKNARTLETLWKQLSKVPGGKTLFTRIIGFNVPYTGTLKGACVERFEPGNVHISLAPKRITRNHLGDAHALALSNIGEMSSGLSFLLLIPKGVKATICDIRTEYIKRAQGPLLVSPDNVSFPEFEGQTQHEVAANITNADGIVVSRVVVTWSIKAAK